MKMLDFCLFLYEYNIIMEHIKENGYTSEDKLATSLLVQRVLTWNMFQQLVKNNLSFCKTVFIFIVLSTQAMNGINGHKTEFIFGKKIWSMEFLNDGMRVIYIKLRYKTIHCNVCSSQWCTLSEPSCSSCHMMPFFLNLGLMDSEFFLVANCSSM